MEIGGLGHGLNLALVLALCCGIGHGLGLRHGHCIGIVHGLGLGMSRS
jgi:hypothetical protein